MNCENKNNVLDLYFREGSESQRNATREHIEKCVVCQKYFAELKQTMGALDKLDDDQPSVKVFENIMADVSTSVPKPVKQKAGMPVVPILQIAFGQIFLFAVIYILNLKLTLAPFWNAIRDNWFVKSFGGYGIAVIIVLCIGSFISLSLAPILLFESKGKKKFS
ncbi:MAG: hypothetical protein V1720_04680 [bacterium]